jgi:hypothetical protein
MKYTLLILLFFTGVASNLQSQNLTGVWRGKFGNSFMGLTSWDYKFEVQIDHRNINARGVTYSYKNTEFYAKAAMKGTWDKQKKLYILNEGKILEVRKMSTTFTCRMDCYLTYSKRGNEEYLEGYYESFSDTDGSPCGSGKVMLKRVVNSVFKKESFLVKREQQQVSKRNNIKPNNTVSTKPKNTKTKPATKPTAVKKTTEPKTAPLLPKTENPTVKTNTQQKTNPTIKKGGTPNLGISLRNRKNELAKEILVDADEVIVEFYDNGEVDGDTISVYLNNNVLLNKQLLTSKPITLKLKKQDLNSINELTMVAENLGTIPPNTALMTVKVGNNNYRIRMESTEQKNAMVKFAKNE